MTWFIPTYTYLPTYAFVGHSKLTPTLGTLAIFSEAS
jgi:hypothetical protein